MKDFDPRTTPGSFSHNEGLALGECAVKAPDGPIMELGCYLGSSFCYMAHALMQAGKAPTMYASDTWRLPGCNDGWSGSAENLQSFIANVALLEYPGEIIRIEINAEELRRIWRIPLALVHLDYDHSYESTKPGLEDFGCCVMPGGYVGVHGYGEGFPGVITACNEFLEEHPDWEVAVLADQEWIIRRLR